MEFYVHNIENEDIEELNKTLKTPFLTTGPVTKRFEKKFKDYFNKKNCIGVTSCTAALHLALLAYGVGEGDEVITTPMTFVATANAILHCGATPVFVDVEPNTGNINPDLIEEKITSKTKAIIPVHLYGVICDMKKIYNIAEKHNLKVISDCAHALEGIRDNYNSAEYCHASCYSFYATKNLASGEGGAIITDDDEIADKLRVLRLHGMSKSAIDRYSSSYKHYDVQICGWKYNMDDIHASLLIHQLDRLNDNLKKRNELYKKYLEVVKPLNKISISNIPENCKSAHHLFVIKVNDTEKRDFYLKKLQDLKIPVAVNFNPVHLMSYYKKTFGYKKNDFPIAENFGFSIITLPFYVKLKDSDFKIIADGLQKIFK